MRGARLVILALMISGLAFGQNDYENLQVLPKDISKDRLGSIMKAWSSALGVRCNFCHVGEKGAPLSTYDFVSDENHHKDMTRTMVKMVKSINGEHLGEMAKGKQVVNCRTCHHGLKEPQTLAQSLTKQLDRKGLDEAVAYYGKLRKRYYGSDSYDFSEGSLASMGGRLVRQGKTKEAIRFLELNLEYFPKSAHTHLVLGDAHKAAGSSDKAKASYQKVLELDPGNEDAKEKLGAM